MQVLIGGTMNFLSVRSPLPRLNFLLTQTPELFHSLLWKKPMGFNKHQSLICILTQPIQINLVSICFVSRTQIRAALVTFSFCNSVPSLSSSKQESDFYLNLGFPNCNSNCPNKCPFACISSDRS